jgi:hypothetical protein
VPEAPAASEGTRSLENLTAGPAPIARPGQEPELAASPALSPRD